MMAIEDFGGGLDGVMLEELFVGFSFSIFGPGLVGGFVLVIGFVLVLAFRSEERVVGGGPAGFSPFLMAGWKMAAGSPTATCIGRMLCRQRNGGIV